MDYSEFNGRVAVVTGAASGMGLLTSRLLAGAGAKVVMCDIAAEALNAAADGIRAAGGEVVTVVTDVRRYDDAKAAADAALGAFGRIDLLLCYAGGYEPRCCQSAVPFYEQPVEVIDWGLDVNLRGPVYFARAVMPAMVRQRSGVIVCLGSINGMEGDANGPMYGASKSGLFNFVKSLALAGSPHGVRALCVAPGPVLTRPGMAALRTPLGRAAEPQEVVDFVLTLCGKGCAFVTGTTNFIDGGYTCKFAR